MEKSKVYFTDFRTQVGTSWTVKLQRLCIAAGIKNIDFDKKFVAIKMHFGELGNLSFLRPNYAKAIADLVKEQGGLPFLTDCNTLYPGSRKNALEHIECANINGFNSISTGCQIIIGDGLKGTDDVEVPVKNGEICKTAKIGRAVMDADVFISLAHFKGHEATGFGGAIKNIGMGCGSRAGKMEQHSSGKVVVNPDKCRGCQKCAKECGSDVDLRTDEDYYQTCSNLTSYRSYLQRFPSGKYVTQAKSRIEELRFKQCKTVADYQKFISDYPNSKFIAKAKEELNRFKKEEEERRARIERQERAISSCSTTDEIVSLYAREKSNSINIDKCSLRAFELAKCEEDYRKVLSIFGVRTFVTFTSTTSYTRTNL